MATVYRDSSGKRLADYEQPSVAVDTALLTVPLGGALSVLQVRDEGDGDWRLPGTFLHAGERLADAVARSLLSKAGVSGRSPRELHVFDEPARDTRGWVLSVAHMDAVGFDRLELDSERARVIPVDDVGEMVHGHNAILAFAVEALRQDYEKKPDPAGLIDEPFTMTELRRVHEAVAGRELLPDTFRRASITQLRRSKVPTIARSGRPAALYRRSRGT